MRYTLSLVRSHGRSTPPSKACILWPVRAQRSRGRKHCTQWTGRRPHQLCRQRTRCKLFVQAARMYQRHSLRTASQDLRLRQLDHPRTVNRILTQELRQFPYHSVRTGLRSRNRSRPCLQHTRCRWLLRWVHPWQIPRRTQSSPLRSGTDPQGTPRTIRRLRCRPHNVSLSTAISPSSCEECNPDGSDIGGDLQTRLSLSAYAWLCPAATMALSVPSAVTSVGERRGCRSHNSHGVSVPNVVTASGTSTPSCPRAAAPMTKTAPLVFSTIDGPSPLADTCALSLPSADTSTGSY